MRMYEENRMPYLIGQKVWLVKPVGFVGSVCAVSSSFAVTITTVATQKISSTLAKDEKGGVYSFGGRSWSDHGRMPDIPGALHEQEERRVFSDVLNIYKGIEGDFDPGLEEPLQFVDETRSLIDPPVAVCFCLTHKNAFYFNDGNGYCSSCRQEEIKAARVRVQEKARARLAA